MILTVGNLAKKFGLSRSTLLYYDGLGLLSPRGHAKGAYRRYGREEELRLEQICRYRKAGITLQDIGKILDSPETSLRNVLEQRFADLSHEIKELLEQQRVIAGLLKAPEIMTLSGVMTKEMWISLLEHAGFSAADMRRWHIRFEQTDPEQHQIFLEYLQIPADEIAFIRQWAVTP
jgi:DNA-binding transcriptional MerR regulator